MKIDIPNYPNYYLDTDCWQIYSFYKKGYLKPILKREHLYIELSGKQFSLHRLIYSLMVNKIPEGYDVHHIDHNPLNNNPENLCLLSHSEHLSHHHLNTHHSEETKKRLSTTHKAIPHKITPEQRANMANAHRGKKHKPSIHPSQRKMVLMFKDGVLIKEYPYVNATAEDGFKPANVCQCCQGTRKSHKGYCFQYKEANT